MSQSVAFGLWVVILNFTAPPAKIRLSTKVTKEHEEKTFVTLHVLRGYFSSDRW